MRILGIETSCDETAASIVRDGQWVESSVIASQIERHQLFGGVVPEIAAREHLKMIDEVVRESLRAAKCSLEEVDAVAVTQGPGLVGALLVGIAYAKGLAMAGRLPLVPVNHVHAHMHGAFLGLDTPLDDLFPCLGLVVSGGHTNLYWMQGPTAFELVASSIDDACGESFDKVSKLLGMPYPGGPHVEKLAKKGDPSRFSMPRMVDDQSKLLFSYSGLKTHVINLRHRLRDELAEEQCRADLCAAFQEEALDQIVRKFRAALRRFPTARSIVIAGGVAANQRFRSLMQSMADIPVFFPQLRFCSDNAAMIAALGFHEYQARGQDTSRFFNYDWDAFARYLYAKG